MMTDYVRQHYVPQFYLKNFCSDNSQQKIFCHDKLEDRSYPTNIKNVAQENLFYALDKVHNTEIEKRLGIIEQAYFRKPYFELIKLKNVAKLSYQSRANLFLFLALQDLRTLGARIQIKEMYEQFFATLARGLGVDIPESYGAFTQEESKALHLDTLLETKNVVEIAKHLFNKIWVTMVNTTGTPLWTSDNPVCYGNSFKYEGNLGIWSPGVEIRFPLNTGLLLYSYDPQKCKHVNNRQKMLKSDVEVANELQVKNSTKIIFSPKDNFEKARKYLQLHRECRKSPRPMKVSSSDDTYEFTQSA